MWSQIKHKRCNAKKNKVHLYHGFFATCLMFPMAIVWWDCSIWFLQSNNLICQTDFPLLWIPPLKVEKLLKITQQIVPSIVCSSSTPLLLRDVILRQNSWWNIANLKSSILAFKKRKISMQFLFWYHSNKFATKYLDLLIDPSSAVSLIPRWSPTCLSPPPPPFSRSCSSQETRGRAFWFARYFHQRRHIHRHQFMSDPTGSFVGVFFAWTNIYWSLLTF